MLRTTLSNLDFPQHIASLARVMVRSASTSSGGRNEAALAQLTSHYRPAHQFLVALKFTRGPGKFLAVTWMRRAFSCRNAKY